MNLEDNMSLVLSKIESAMNKSRFNQSVELIAVTKTVESDIINQAVSLGVKNIGENKVQEIQRKYPDISGDVRWHLIGTLQTNIVKYIADKVDMIHSLDRIELAKEINRQAVKHNRIIKCLIQVKISEEDTKHGVDIENARGKLCLRLWTNSKTKRVARTFHERPCRLLLLLQVSPR